MVTDKVLVHRGLSSLDVLVIGLGLVSLFEVILGGLRVTIFSHTTSRIDVELGASLFRHLMGLPMAYFGARQAGTTVARVRELENIRSFLTGSALTLVIDALFTVVFFAVMFVYSTTLTWIVLATIPLYVGLSLAVTPLLKRRIDLKFPPRRRKPGLSGSKRSARPRPARRWRSSRKCSANGKACCRPMSAPRSKRKT